MQDKASKDIETVPTVIATKERVLKLHNKYTRNLMMCLMALGALKAHVPSR